MQTICNILPDNDKEAVESGPRGTISFVTDSGNRVTGCIQKCPGCDNVSFLRFRPCNEQHPSWDWNGNRALPSLTPSVHHKSGCGSHTYLRNGVWIPA